MSTQRMTSVERYGHRAGESPDEVKRRATGFVARFINKGGQLIIGFAYNKAGQLVLTVAVAVGRQVFQSPSLDMLAAGLGAVTAIHFLVEYSRYRNKHGGIALDPEELKTWELIEPEMSRRGAWTEADAWEQPNR
jgi:hypothetical protein